MQVVKGLENLAEAPRKTVLTIGNFDGVHLGHREVFRRVIDRARKLCATSGVVTFEPHPLRFLAPDKAPLRLNTPEEKIRLLEASCIDLLVVLNFDQALAEMSAEDFVKDVLVGQLNVHYLIVGYDYAFGHNRHGDTDSLAAMSQKYGFTLEVLEPVRSEQQTHSSTSIRQLLQEGRVEEVVKILGRNFTLDGVVVHGEGRGRKLGFPTANLITEKEILPRDGVYAVKVKWQDHYYDGVINIGSRPTFTTSEPTLEIHLIDFKSDLYGERLRIYFVGRLRDEMKFPSVEALQDAVIHDIKRARALFSNSQVVEYREYLDCGYNALKNGSE